jgi:bacterioferritin-associated ferredoxin
MYVCLCHAITEREIRRHVTADCSVSDVYRAQGVKPKCGKCVATICAMLRWKAPAAPFDIGALADAAA